MTRLNLAQAFVAAVVAVALPAMFIGCDKGPETPPTPSTAPHDRVPVPTTAGSTAAADAAAQATIDKIKAYIAKGDFAKAREELATLKMKGVYDPLSQNMKDAVDGLSKSIPAEGGPTTMPQGIRL